MMRKLWSWLRKQWAKGTAKADGDLTPRPLATQWRGGTAEAEGGAGTSPSAVGLSGGLRAPERENDDGAGQEAGVERQLAELRRQVEALETLAAWRQGSDAGDSDKAEAADEVALEKAADVAGVRPGRPQSLAGQRQPVTERGNMWEGVL